MKKADDHFWMPIGSCQEQVWDIRHAAPAHQRERQNMKTPAVRLLVSKPALADALKRPTAELCLPTHTWLGSSLASPSLSECAVLHVLSAPSNSAPRNVCQHSLIELNKIQ